MILVPKKINSVTVSILPPPICHGTRCHDLSFLNEIKPASPALEGRFLITGPPGKSHIHFLLALILTPSFPLPLSQLSTYYSLFSISQSFVFPFHNHLLASISSFLSSSCYCPFSHLPLYLFTHRHSHKCIFPNILSYSFFFFTTTEGFLPTSIINLGACCLLALSIEALFSTYCIFRERNVTAFLVMKLLPFDIIRLRKHSVGCLGDICKYYNNGTIGELPLCFFVFSQSRSEPNLGDFLCSQVKGICSLP